MNRIKLL